MILDLAVASPDALALSDDLGSRRTRAELVDRAVRIGHLLRDDLGVGVGGHVAVLSDNRVEVFEIYLAAVLSGVWFVPVNGLLAPHEVDYVVRDADAAVVITEPEFRHLVPDGVAVVELGADFDRRVAEADAGPGPGSATRRAPPGIPRASSGRSPPRSPRCSRCRSDSATRSASMATAPSS